MALTKFTTDIENIQALSDKPNEVEGLTADQLKKKFDDAAIDIKTYLNETLTDEIDTQTTTLQTGWIATTGTYASASTITVASGAASIYSKGDKLRLKQGGAYKYFYIIDFADTLLTVTGGTDYTVEDAAITDMYYSHEVSPVGFPNVFAYTPIATNLTLGTGGTINGQFSLIGKTLSFRVYITLGTSGAGTGNLSLSLPITISTANGTIPLIGQGSVLAGGTGYQIFINKSGVLYAPATAGAHATFAICNATVPVTFGVDNEICIDGLYEIA